MPAEHFRRLIREECPGVSPRQLELAAGLSENSVSYWLRPTTVIDRMPKVETMKELATAVGCDPRFVIEAFAADCGLDWGATIDLDPDERQLLRLFRKLKPEARRSATAMVRTLTHL